MIRVCELLRGDRSGAVYGAHRRTIGIAQSYRYSNGRFQLGDIHAVWARAYYADFPPSSRSTTATWTVSRRVAHRSPVQWPEREPAPGTCGAWA